MYESGFRDSHPPTPKGFTWRSRNKLARSTYDPDWSPTRPWSVVYNGEVKSYQTSLEQARIILRNRYNCY